MFREKMPQAHRDHAMPPRQRAQHRQPDAEVAERAVDAQKRRALPDIEVGHVISVDAEALHATSLARSGSLQSALASRKGCSSDKGPGTGVQDCRNPGGSQYFPSLDS